MEKMLKKMLHFFISKTKYEKFIKGDIEEMEKLKAI
jgi:hypothetical protein